MINFQTENELEPQLISVQITNLTCSHLKQWNRMTYVTYFGHYRCDTPDPPASTSVKTAGNTMKGEPKGKRGGAALMAAAIANATESPSGR